METKSPCIPLWTGDMQWVGRRAEGGFDLRRVNRGDRPGAQSPGEHAPHSHTCSTRHAASATFPFFFLPSFSLSLSHIVLCLSLHPTASSTCICSSSHPRPSRHGHKKFIWLVSHVAFYSNGVRAYRFHRLRHQYWEQSNKYSMFSCLAMRSDSLKLFCYHKMTHIKLISHKLNRWLVKRGLKKHQVTWCHPKWKPFQRRDYKDKHTKEQISTFCLINTVNKAKNTVLFSVNPFAVSKNWPVTSKLHIYKLEKSKDFMSFKRECSFRGKARFWKHHNDKDFTVCFINTENTAKQKILHIFPLAVWLLSVQLSKIDLLTQNYPYKSDITGQNRWLVEKGWKIRRLGNAIWKGTLFQRHSKILTRSERWTKRRNIHYSTRHVYCRGHRMQISLLHGVCI